jgi:hypothetical protein
VRGITQILTADKATYNSDKDIGPYSRADMPPIAMYQSDGRKTTRKNSETHHP